MKRLIAAFGAVAWMGLFMSRADAADVSGLDPDGYIRDWLMLAPIALPEGASAGDLLLRPQIPEEFNLKPKAGDTVTANGRPLTWRNLNATTNFFDFNAVLKTQNDRAVGYAVTYME
ncbi:MAG TPA: hypothetical protein PLX89_10175 [Verrucomicrobiota bacterium]|nr:hypothetical protein [Verrucomicrobiales bacterium]HRI13363.1 hypothetical protein [Verrucomicrobiota bacterium]